MALVLIKEDGSGKADANSYATVADGDAYHDGHLYAVDWKTANPDTRAASLVMATRLIDAYVEFRGTKAHDGQGLRWPRKNVVDEDSGAELAIGCVPKGVLTATCELARRLIKTDRTADPEGQGIRTVTEFSTRSVTYDPSDRRPVLPELVQIMLSPFGRPIETKGGNPAVPLVRV